MKMMPAENIRAFRKERSLPQNEDLQISVQTIYGSQFEKEGLTTLWKSVAGKENHHE